MLCLSCTQTNAIRNWEQGGGAKTFPQDGGAPFVGTVVSQYGTSGVLPKEARGPLLWQQLRPWAPPRTRTYTHTHTQSLEISSVWHTDTINQLISLLLTVPRRLLLLIFRWCVTLAFVSLSYFTRPFPCSFFQPQVWPLSPYPFSFCAFIPYSCLCPYHHHHSFHFYRHLKKIPQITRHLSPPPHKNSVILAPKWIRQHKMIPSFWGINQGMGRGIIAQKLMHISYLLWYTFWSMHNVVTV